jgi:hypothetical protein
MIQIVSVKSESKGASWKGSLEKKFLKYVSLLEQYYREGHQDFRTLYYTGVSYQNAAGHSRSKRRAKEYLQKAKEYHERASEDPNLAIKDKILFYSALAAIRIELNEEWAETEQILLNAYAIDIQKGESIEPIIYHYISTKQWNSAYLFSSFAYDNYNGRDPSINVHDITQPKLYSWEFMLYHSICAFMSGRIEEAKILRQKLNSLIINNFESFSMKDIIRIRKNTPLNLSLRYFSTFIKKACSTK